MTKHDAIVLIDNHRLKLIDQKEMADWTWLLLIINYLDDDAWEIATHRALNAIVEDMRKHRQG